MTGTLPSGSFVAYDKMEQASGKVGAVAGLRPRSTESDSYVVTEKVHGANFCAIAAFPGDVGPTAPVEVRFAKRNAIIGTAEDAQDLFGCRSSGLLAALVPRVEAVLRRMTQEVEEGQAAIVGVHIYGELFGGAYPHPDVEAVEGLRPVQAGVWYAPDLHFRGFDVAVEELSTEGLSRRYLDFNVAREVCLSAGLEFVEPLFQGTLAECLEIPYEFETTVPARLGLPPLPPGSDVNLAEGVVIRPAKEPRQPQTTTVNFKDSLRGLFKRKPAAFSERQYQNDDGKAGGSQEDLAWIEISALITEQRLANVLSKTGRVDPTDDRAFRQLLKDFKEDVVDELGDGTEAQLLRESPALQVELYKACRRVIARVLLTDLGSPGKQG